MAKVVVFGCSGHAKVVIDALEQDGQHKIVGLLGRTPDARDNWFGYPVLGGDEVLPTLIERHSDLAGIIAIGENSVRAKVHAAIVQGMPGFPFVCAVHPSARMGRGVRLGEGVFVAAGAVICADATIGAQVIVNTSASVDHDCVLNDFSSIGPGAALGGNVRLGRTSHIGLGSRVIQNINIGANVIVGAGAVVIRDLPDSCLAIGVPAVVKKQLTSPL